MDLGLAGKKAFIGGSSRGLGFAAARMLVQEGCDVAINGRDLESLEEASRTLQKINQGKVVTIPGDLADPTLPSNLIPSAAEQLGGLDILITNTGGPPTGTFESFGEETWQRAIDLSFMSHVRMIKEALPYLRDSQHASVLTVTSYSVKQPIPNLILSNSIRSATIGLTKSLALELGSDGIRFNSILPAYTETERVLELIRDQARKNNRTIEEQKQQVSSASSLGRMGKPEEFGKAAAFLVSPAASYLTGVMLTVDGGMYKGTC